MLTLFLVSTVLPDLVSGLVITPQFEYSAHLYLTEPKMANFRRKFILVMLWHSYQRSLFWLRIYIPKSLNPTFGENQTFLTTDILPYTALNSKQIYLQKQTRLLKFSLSATVYLWQYPSCSYNQIVWFLFRSCTCIIIWKADYNFVPERLVIHNPIITAACCNITDTD